MGPQIKILVKRGVSQRLHNRRINMVVTPEDDYQVHVVKALAPGEAEELRMLGHRDSLKDYNMQD